MTVRGHRLLPNTADCIIEAWGPNRAACVSEALEALVEEFAEVEDPPSTRLLPLCSGPAGGKDVLVTLLEEVIFTLDVFSVIPARFHLCDTADGGVSGDMEVVPISEARVVGPVPKAVSYHGLVMTGDGRGWTCRVLVDV